MGLPVPLQKQVICIVDLPFDAGREALRHAALRAVDSVASCEHAETDDILCNFLELTLKESLCCYGAMQTQTALEMGAVEHLLLGVDVGGSLGADGWKALAASYGTSVVEIYPRNELSTRFCESFGIGDAFDGRWICICWKRKQVKIR